ncbi:MAG TPA: hypothetical protein DD441_10035 [Parabacteroides distasonis]|nr:hypothetical protein [Parabacteroides distasonis]
MSDKYEFYVRLLFRKDKGGIINFKSEEDMNTPSEKMLKEAARCIKRQNNYEKWEQLSPLSNLHNFTVDFQRILFTSNNFVRDEDERSLPLNCIFGTLRKDNFLYILCKNGMLYILELEDNSWSMRFPVDCPSSIGQFLCTCQSTAVKAARWFSKHNKK